MIRDLSSLAVTVAALLFCASLFLGHQELARTLRRAAAFLFAMAFVPPLVVCVARGLRFPHSPVAFLELVLAAVGAVAIAATVSLAAYGFLDLKKRGSSRQPQAHADRGYTKRRDDRRDADRYAGGDDE